jgi:hypothetical protein
VSICILLCIHRARRVTEQQSNRALCRSRDPCSVRLSSAGQASCSYDVQRRPLPEAIITPCLRPSAKANPCGAAIRNHKSRL